MTFSDLYTKNINKIIDYEKSNIDKPVFVILGQTELYKPQKHEDYLTDKETFTLDGNENLFNNDWFTRVFLFSYNFICPVFLFDISFKQFIF